MNYIPKRFRAPFGLVLGAAALLAAGSVQAQSVAGSDQFDVTATVLGQCTVTSSDLNFGSYTQGGGAVTAQSNVNVVCPVGFSYEVGLDNGQNAPGATTSRAMAGGLPADTLDYELFTTVGLATVWGDTFGVDTQSGLGDFPNAQNFTVFGQIPALQTSNPGTYADIVTTTILF